MYGCSMGVAGFEQIEAQDFNPNVALEVGNMYAMRKPLCLLKDLTLRYAAANRSSSTAQKGATCCPKTWP